VRTRARARTAPRGRSNPFPLARRSGRLRAGAAGGRAGGPLSRAPVIEAAAPERRAFVYALGAVNVLFLAIDVASAWPHAAAVVLGRAVLGTVLFGSAMALGRVRTARAARAVMTLGGAAAAACLGVVAWGAGGAQGPYLALLPILPMILFIAAPDVPLALGACGAVVAVPGMAMLVAAGAEGPTLALWAAAFASGTGYGVTGAALHERARRREAQAVAALAVSEERRARAERLALAGRLAAGVVHGVNNPLASVLANVRYAEDALARASGDRDVAEALADARHGLERIRRLMVDLAALTRDVPAECGPLDLVSVIAEARRLAEVRGVTLERLQLAPGLPPVRGRRQVLVQIVAGVLVSAAEAARGEGGAPSPVGIAARLEGSGVVVSVEALAAPRTDRGAFGEDLLVLLARERLEDAGGALETFAGAGGPGLRLLLPAATDIAAADPSA
jgi:signal transduction histidine kinase